MKEFNSKVIEILNIVEEKETINIQNAAKVIYDALRKDGILHVFATGHSHMFCEELFYRAGGLVPINPVLVPALMQHEGAIRSTKLERLSGLAKPIYEGINKTEKDPFIIVSNSGINSVPVEMAEIVKDNNHPVIVLTSVEASINSTPRTINNKRLCEVADIVIDNHVPKGDGVLVMNDTQVGAVSSIVSSYIAQTLVLEIIKLYEKDGLIAPIYKSANTLGGDEHNKKLFEKYQSRISGLL